MKRYTITLECHPPFFRKLAKVVLDEIEAHTSEDRGVRSFRKSHQLGSYDVELEEIEWSPDHRMPRGSYSKGWADKYESEP